MGSMQSGRWRPRRGEAWACADPAFAGRHAKGLIWPTTSAGDYFPLAVNLLLFAAGPLVPVESRAAGFASHPDRLAASRGGSEYGGCIDFQTFALRRQFEARIGLGKIAARAHLAVDVSRIER